MKMKLIPLLFALSLVLMSPAVQAAEYVCKYQVFGKPLAGQKDYKFEGTVNLSTDAAESTVIPLHGKVSGEKTHFILEVREMVDDTIWVSAAFAKDYRADGTGATYRTITSSMAYFGKDQPRMVLHFSGANAYAVLNCMK